MGCYSACTGVTVIIGEAHWTLYVFHLSFILGTEVTQHHTKALHVFISWEIGKSVERFSEICAKYLRQKQKILKVNI